MDLQFYRDSINRHGIGATFYHVAYRAAKRVTDVAVWNAVSISMSQVDKQFLTLDEGRGQMVDAEHMRPYSIDPKNQLDRAFIDEAAAKGDRCYAIFDGDKLASYGWYSSRPTRLTEVPGAPVLHFDASYSYMYNGFTAPEYRGKRLHAFNMAAALALLSREGLRGLVGYVDSSNFSSLKSCHRMGYRTFGRVLLVQAGNRRHAFSTPGCKRYDFRVETTG